MNSPLRQIQMSALAYLYDNRRDLPAWFRRLTPGQLEDIAKVMVQWNAASENSILPMAETEKREVLRVLVICGGSISKAAKLLQMGKTTIYRKLVEWGYSVEERILIEQASALCTKSEAPTQESHHCG
jgi:transcriptional regulator of acetoin/glycerol metabolism